MKRILLYIVIYISILIYSTENQFDGRIIEPLNSIREFIRDILDEGMHILLPIIPMLVIYILFDNRLKKLDKK